MTKLLSLLLLNLFISIPTYAQVKEQKDIKFQVKTEALMKGEVHYAFDTASPSKLIEKYPELYDLDSLAILQESNVEIVIGKSAYIVDRPAGFFDHERTEDENYINHILGEQKIKKLSGNAFKITIPGKSEHSYQIKSYFDSDEISTLPNSKVIRAVSQARKLDVISQSASSTVIKELTHFTKYGAGGIQVSSFIPLKENKTLILSYSMSAVKKDGIDKDVLQANFKQEAVAQKQLINSYKHEQMP